MLKYLLMMITLIMVVPVRANSDVEMFQHTWVAKALKLQREIDLNIPLNNASMLATHNSENAISYQIPFIRYIDPNQILSLTDQLQMGVRNLELDVQWYTSSNLKKDILLCHGLNDHSGCSVFDRQVNEGLQEIRAWLQSHPHEMVLLYFDRGTALEGHELRLTAYLQEYLGEFIYKPTDLTGNRDGNSNCVALPGSITKAEILKAGKQLLIVTKGCDGDNPGYQEQDQFPLKWNDYVFAGIGHVPHHEFTFLDSTIGNDFTPYPDCSSSTVFADDKDHSIPWRIFEDRTMLSNFLNPGRQLLAADVKTMVNCGINWQTLDMLSVDDDRLIASIWSWAKDYPKSGQGNCAYYEKNTGIKNLACDQVLSAFACQSTLDNSFQIASQAASWEKGETICQTLLGKTWHFAAPINGKQMYLLKQTISQLGLKQVWLNYHRVENESWYAKNTLEK
jgi:hypothetical protein